MKDTAHGELHIQAVRVAAKKLGLKYAPGQLRLIDVAALYHDIGRAIDDEHHEEVGANLLMTSPEYADLRSQFAPADWIIIVDAVRQHRASNGNPQTIVARIISDADRMGKPDEMGPLKRAYLYRLERGYNHTASLQGAAAHLMKKYGPGGTGLRVYFDETREWIETIHAPVFAAYERQDWVALEAMLETT